MPMDKGKLEKWMQKFSIKIWSRDPLYGAVVKDMADQLLMGRTVTCMVQNKLVRISFVRGVLFIDTGG